MQPSCFRPDAISVSGRAQNSASFAWTASTAGAATDYDVAVVSLGGNPANVTPVSVTGISYLVAGLQTSTPYPLYVRSHCGNGYVNAWRVPVGFTTLHVASTIPFFSPFATHAHAWGL